MARKSRRRRHLLWAHGATALCGLNVPDRGHWGNVAVCRNCERIAERRGLPWDASSYVVNISSLSINGTPVSPTASYTLAAGTSTTVSMTGSFTFFRSASTATWATPPRGLVAA